MTDIARSKLKVYLELIVTVTAIVAAIWAASLKPLTREIARDEAKSAVRELRNENREGQRAIMQKLDDLDARLYDLAASR